MKLKSISNQSDEIDQLVRSKLPSKLANKILDFAIARRRYTDPSEQHTISKSRQELLDGRRLVALVWSDDVDESLDGLYITGDDRQLVVSLPEHSDIADLVNQGIDSVTGHIVRGIVFGYDPNLVYEFSMRRKWNIPWKKCLKGLGIELAEDRGGYSSVADDDSWISRRLMVPTGVVVVFPDAAQKVKDNLHKLGKLLFITRWCPECNAEIVVTGIDKIPTELEVIGPDRCGHNSTKGHYEFCFDITNILPKLTKLL